MRRAADRPRRRDADRHGAGGRRPGGETSRPDEHGAGRARPTAVPRSRRRHRERRAPGRRATMARVPSGDRAETSGFGLAGTPTGRRVRARLARFNAPWQTPQVSEVLEPLIADPPGQPPQGRRPAAAAGLRHGRPLALGAVPQVRRPVHHPPARGRDDPGQPRHGHHHAGGRAAARHDRGHRLHAGRDARRLRRRGRAAGRRRDQARQGQAGRRGQGRDDPQDGRRDGQGPAGAGDQAGRPAAQHAHADLPAAAPSRSRRPRRRWRSWPRWRTGSA